MFKIIKDSFSKPQPHNVTLQVSDLLLLAGFIRPLWKPGLASLLLTMLTTALTSSLPLNSKLLIDFAIMKKSLDNVEAFLRSMHLTLLIDPVTCILGSAGRIIIVIVAVGLTIGLLRLLQKMIISDL